MKRHLRSTVAVLAVSCCLPIAGCWSRVDKLAARRPKTYPASGRVLWNGEPAAGVIVSLDSKSHRLSAVGMTDSTGRFTLKTFKPGDGAASGEHGVRLDKIEITGHDANGTPIEVSVMPAKYADAKTSCLTATVVEKGKNEFTFEVTGPRRPR
jgi:hypothetical protein